jgi:GTP-binding protein YchF
MKAALIGLPQSGKSTLFTAITGHSPAPAQTGQEHIASVKVPDPRLDVLARMFKPDRITQATLEFVDFPGFSLATPQGQGEFRRHAANLRTCDVLVAVVRAFSNPDVPPYRDRIDPAADLAELHTELVFADLEVVTGRMDRLKKQIAKPTSTREHDRRELALLERCQTALESDRALSGVTQFEEDRQTLKSFSFLTHRPLVVVINVDETDLGKPPPLRREDLAHVLTLSAPIEAEIAQLDAADRAVFLADLGITEPASDNLIHACYRAMGLISFLTVGDNEARAWSIPAGLTAVEAAGKVHTDMARGFIRAETVAFDDLAAAGDMKAAKAHGKVRLEGKGYVVKDGDVILFRFNV